jgi:hypothetical protein
MKKYEMKGGGTIEAKNKKDLLNKLRMLSFNPGNSMEDYIKETAKACLMQNGAEIRTTNEHDFIEDLIQHEFLKETE